MLQIWIVGKTLNVNLNRISGNTTYGLDYVFDNAKKRSQRRCEK